MERRLESAANAPKSSSLPHDYLEMIKEVFTANFDPGLKALAALRPDPHFQIHGAIYSNEIVLSATLIFGEELSATTVHASMDFDPKASAPTVQDLLGACVDAIGTVFEPFLNVSNPKRIQQLAAESLSGMDEVPYEWTAIDVDRFKVHLKMDKSNPKLDELADEWLRKNDPDLSKLEEEDRKEAEKLFVTGPKKSEST